MRSSDSGTAPPRARRPAMARRLSADEGPAAPILRLTRERILDAALRMVLERGPRRLSITDLALSLGVVKSALYHHISGGKGAIIVAALQREEERVVRAMEEAMAGAHDFRGRLLAGVRARVDHAVNLGRLYDVREPVVDEFEAYVAQRRRNFYVRERALIARLVRDAITAGEVGDVDADLVAATVEGGISELIRAGALGSADGKRALLEQFVDLLALGVQPPGGGLTSTAQASLSLPSSAPPRRTSNRNRG